jgi:aminoglycoside 6'-N-acetyltransferase I
MHAYDIPIIVVGNATLRSARVPLRTSVTEGLMNANLGITIRIARPADCNTLAQLRKALWPESSLEQHARDLGPVLEGTASLTMPLISLVAEASSHQIAGFVEVGLRSHADGCDASRPVGYIEGWYAAGTYRHQGIGRKLLEAAEDWARSQGCAEMASDSLIENELSQRAHEALGYNGVDRCVYYRKVL